MKKISIHTELVVYESKAELPEAAQRLMDAAQKARQGAYAPYSDFKVGAAILLEDGIVVSGSNQENASFPVGQCAERTAIFAAGASHPGKTVKMIAIMAGSVNKTTSTPIPPCGICRQTIAEYELKQNSPIEIYFSGETGEIMYSHSVANILPLLFDNSEL